MNRFVLKPNLPEGSVTHVIIGAAYKYLLDLPLKKQGITPIYIPDNPYVDPRVAGHADLSVLHLGGNKLYLAPYLKNSGFSATLEALGFQITYPDIAQSADYPNDVQLNICIAGDMLITRKGNKIADRISDNYSLRKLECRQGYSRCVSCVVDERTIISSDAGIYKELSCQDYNVLLITQGNIALPGYDYGFLGGASFKLSKDKLAFTGRLDSHPDKEIITDFILSCGITPVFLTDYPVFDIGTAIPIIERA